MPHRAAGHDRALYELSWGLSPVDFWTPSSSFLKVTQGANRTWSRQHLWSSVLIHSKSMFDSIHMFLCHSVCKEGQTAEQTQLTTYSDGQNGLGHRNRPLLRTDLCPRVSCFQFHGPSYRKSEWQAKHPTAYTILTSAWRLSDSTLLHLPALGWWGQETPESRLWSSGKKRQRDTLLPQVRLMAGRQRFQGHRTMLRLLLESGRVSGN